MSLELFGWIILLLFFVLLSIRVPIWISLSLTALFGMLLEGYSVSMYADLMQGSMGQFTLLTIPFFICAGKIIGSSRKNR